MPITVQNITATSAMVNWPSAPGCLDTFYSIMYHPNWNSLLMGYTRKSFLREDRVPISQTTTFLGNLSPQTTYILCVTCHSASPSRSEQCQVFNTLDESPEMGGGQRELAMGLWLASSLLLLVIAVVLLWACLHSMFSGQEEGQGQAGEGDGCGCPTVTACSPRQSHTLVSGGAGAGAAGDSGDARDGSFSTPSSSEAEEEEEEEEDSQQATVLENPFHVEHGGGSTADSNGLEIGRLSKQANGSPN